MKPSLLYFSGALFALTASLSSISTPAISATISSFSDDFEGESQATNYNSFANWTVSNGTVDTVGPTAFDCQGSSICVDLDGSSANAGDLTTIDDFATGAYVLSFDISGSQRSVLTGDTVTVTFGDLNESFTLSPSAPWQTVTRTVNLSSPDFLTFSHAGADNVGIILDNVAVVPLPAAAYLFGSGLLGLIGIARRRKPR